MRKAHARLAVMATIVVATLGQTAWGDTRPSPSPSIDPSLSSQRGFLEQPAGASDVIHTLSAQAEKTWSTLNPTERQAADRTEPRSFTVAVIRVDGKHVSLQSERMVMVQPYGFVFAGNKNESSFATSSDMMGITWVPDQPTASGYARVAFLQQDAHDDQQTSALLPLDDGLHTVSSVQRPDSQQKTVVVVSAGAISQNRIATYMAALVH